jgi:hypothetical protein
LRKRASPRHAGMLLSTDNRAFIVAAMVYLMLSGAWLLGSGALLAEGALRPVGAHLFTAGLVLSLIYGLGAHMLPRFTGNPIRMGAWPWAQFLALHAGIIVFCAGYALPGVHATLAGGILMWLSLSIYAWRVGPVLWPPPSMPRSAEQ